MRHNVLDFWHLAKNIKVSLGAERKELTSKLLGLAAKGDTGELLRQIGELRINSRDLTFKAKWMLLFVEDLKREV